MMPIVPVCVHAPDNILPGPVVAAALAIVVTTRAIPGHAAAASMCHGHACLALMMLRALATLDLHHPRSQYHLREWGIILDVVR